jgi:hypothetical protein
MSQRFVVTPAAGGAEDTEPRAKGPDPDAGPGPEVAPESPRVDALPILRYCREPSRYGRWCRGGRRPLEGPRTLTQQPSLCGHRWPQVPAGLPSVRRWSLPAGMLPGVTALALGLPAVPCPQMSPASPCSLPGCLVGLAGGAALQSGCRSQWRQFFW